MTFDEQELRQRLVSTADRADSPRIAARSLLSRIRRRRARNAGLMAGPALAVAAIAVAALIVVSGQKPRTWRPPRRWYPA